ncbi:11485_t:CDS:10 [Diversispora eburnea]|uniref:U3 small nucleolar RNA-associated protein 25 n=1 Tax=Diversispora eburnea TaxID=1213867 RepID=A0A9N8V2F1_9GLOM|nr:11485_t:CDS:10 [Diversispora eburnea]
MGEKNKKIKEKTGFGSGKRLSRKARETLKQYGTLNPFEEEEVSSNSDEEKKSYRKITESQLDKERQQESKFDNDDNNSDDFIFDDDDIRKRPASSYKKLIELLQKNSKNLNDREFFKRRKLEEEGKEYIEIFKNETKDDLENTNPSNSNDLKKGNQDKDEKDEFEIHFGDDQPNDINIKIENVDEKKWKISNTEDSILKLVTKYSLDEEEDDKKHEENGPNFISFKLKKKLLNTWEKLNGNKKEMFSELQGHLFRKFNKYQDVLYSNRSYENSQEIRQIYVLHALNHIFKTRQTVLKNNAKITYAHSTNKEIDEFRDQGFTRPKVLILLPFRNSALNENRKRFFDSYSIEADQERIDPKKPADFLETFKGNNDDMFRVGIKFTRKSIKFYSEFYNADIIIASPLGLRMIIGAEEDKKRDFDFLSSIELLIIDQCDSLLMQNWDHVKHIFDHLNLIPKTSHGCDFSRVKNWYLDGRSKYFRQTIIISEYLTPEINALFNKQMLNIAGKLKIKRHYEGTILEVIPQIKQIFIRIDSPSISEDDDIRFKYFTEQKSYPELSHTMIFIPSYFDFVRLRNYFEDKDYSFASICERYNIRGIRHIVFYSLPDHPHFYSEINDFLILTKNEVEDESKLSCHVLFSKFDLLRLERIVGTSRVNKMLQGNKNIFMFS